MSNSVLVVGDIMLDEFIYGDVTRISPESASPVLSATHTDRMIGGAGNVARGVVALGGECDLVSVIGNDDAGHVLIKEIRKLPQINPYISVDMARATTHKMRFVSEQHSSHLLRVDAECTVPVSGHIEQCILDNALTNDAAVLVLSDYCKGTLTPTIIRALINWAQQFKKPIIVDSKRKDLSVFRGADYVKLNLAELGLPQHASEELIEREARTLANEHGFGKVIVTRGPDGLSVYSGGDYEPTIAPIYIPGKRVRVRDVSGAGDTVVATFAMLLSTGKTGWLPALAVANDAAAIAVGKPGTSSVTMAELTGGDKIAIESWDLLQQRLTEWQHQRVGFVNGCFDLLHPGHIKLLTEARSHCDRLIVGLNSDGSVRALKGSGRPIQNVWDRAAVLAALDCVDLVVVFVEDTPTDLLKSIMPDVMVKGSDYRDKPIAGAEYCGKIVFVERTDEHSTTAIVKKITPLPETLCIGHPEDKHGCQYPECGCPLEANGRMECRVPISQG